MGLYDVQCTVGNTTHLHMVDQSSHHYNNLLFAKQTNKKPSSTMKNSTKKIKSTEQ